MEIVEVEVCVLDVLAVDEVVVAVVLALVLVPVVDMEVDVRVFDVVVVEDKVLDVLPVLLVVLPVLVCKVDVSVAEKVKVAVLVLVPLVEDEEDVCVTDLVVENVAEVLVEVLLPEVEVLVLVVDSLLDVLVVPLEAVMDVLEETVVDELLVEVIELVLKSSRSGSPVKFGKSGSRIDKRLHSGLAKAHKGRRRPKNMAKR